MNINYWAVLVSAVAAMVVGGVWYGPIFGKMYGRIMGWDARSKEEQAEMMKSAKWNYVLQFIASVVMFYTLSVVISAMGMATLMGGIETALLLWFGFVVTLAYGNTLWGGKKAIFWLSIGNMLITLLIAGAIIGGWR